MKRRIAVVAMVGGLVACTRGAPAPVTPVSARPATQAHPTTEAPRPPQAGPVAPVAQASPAAAAGAAPARTPDSARAPAKSASPRAAQDTLKEQAFLDSLHALTADSLRRAAAPTAPAAPPVAPEAVRREAVSMFGRPEGWAAGATWDIDVTSYQAHERVQYWVDFFSGRARWHMERYLERLGRYDSIIRGELAAAGMPRDMIYLAMIESGFNQVARSRVGAVGLWQFMPSTARRYGLTVDAWVDERRDPFVATTAAIRFLAELNDRFGSWYLAAAAYDAGPGKIQKGLARGDFGALTGNDAYFAMAAGHFLRRETRDYVPKLIAAALIAKDPAHYGFTNLDRWSPLRYDSVRVDNALGLNVLARLAAVPHDEIEDMNPAFFRLVTPPDRTVWVRVPRGAGDSVAARLAVLPAKERVTYVTHLVRRGETLSKISMDYGVRIEDIKSANRLRTNFLSVGQRLVVPTSLSRNWRRAAGRYREEDPVRGRARSSVVRRSSPRAAAARPTPVRVSPMGTPVRRMHVVKSGESLWTIANRAHITVESLERANHLPSHAVLRPGQVVRIP